MTMRWKLNVIVWLVSCSLQLPYSLHDYLCSLVVSVVGKIHYQVKPVYFNLLRLACTTDKTQRLFKFVCKTVPKSLFWMSTCLPGFEYVHDWRVKKPFSVCQSCWREIWDASLVQSNLFWWPSLHNGHFFLWWTVHALTLV